MSITKLKAIGLLELMLSLAVIAILLVMATRYYQTTRSSQQVNDAAQAVIAIYSAGNAWLDSNDNFQAGQLQKFVDQNLLPSDFNSANALHANPWGGAITAAPGTATTNLDITMTNVPKADCQNLADKVKAKIPAVASATCSENDKAIFSATINFTSSSQ